MRRTPCAGRSSSATGTSTRPGLRQRGERRAGTARERRPARAGVRHHQVQSRRRGPGRRARAKPRAARVERVDLYIVHWPRGGPTWAWPGMERAHELGYAGSIGVSNFDVAEVEQVVAAATSRRSSTRCSSARTSTGGPPRRLPRERNRARGVQPARNRSPPGERNSDTDRAAPRAHSGPGAAPLVHPARRSADPEVSHRDRIAENAQIFDFTLSDEDMADLDALDRTGGTGEALERKWWR